MNQEASIRKAFFLLLLLQVATMAGVVYLLVFFPPAISEPGAPIIPRENAAMAAIEETLYEIQTELEQLRARAETLGTQLEREPVRDPSSEKILADSVQQLIDRLARLVAVVGDARSQREIQAARQGNPEPHWGQVIRFRDALERDEASTKRALTLLDPASVLRMFGEPTRIASLTDGRIMFEYLRDEDGDGFFEGLNVYFLQGLVVDVSM